MSHGVLVGAIQQVRTLSCLASPINEISTLIQVADTYFYVVIESVSATRIFPALVADYQYSMRLAPWCYSDQNTVGSVYNKLFYGYGVVRSPDFPPYTSANSTLLWQVQINLDHYISNFTTDEGITFTVVRPPVVDPSVDWLGLASQSLLNAVPSRSLLANLKP